MMEPHVKLRVMLAVLGVKRAQEQKELWDAVSHLLTTATGDTDDWCFPTHIIPNTHMDHFGKRGTHSHAAGSFTPPCAMPDLDGVSSPFFFCACARFDDAGYL